jgi:hypothetical protein
MSTRLRTALAIALVCAPALADEGPEADPAEKAAASRIDAVTVYQDTALVTRVVEVPADAGTFDLVVSPLPETTLDSSLYTEATGGLRVLSTRYRTRAVREDTREAVRAKDAEIAGLRKDQQRLQEELQVAEKNLALLDKMENFTSATLAQLSDKGQLDAEATIELADHIMQQRAKLVAGRVETQQSMNDLAESLAFAERERAELAQGVSRTERDALITVQRPEGAEGTTVRLSYLVEGAGWQPKYRFHAEGEDAPVRLQYLAAIEQQTGEDWKDVSLVLSTSQPSLNAAPPPLLALDVALRPAGQMMGMGGGMGGMGGMGLMQGGGQPGDGEQGQGQDAPVEFQKDEARARSLALRKEASRQMLGSGDAEGEALMNQAAALEQAGELLARADAPADEPEPQDDAGAEGGPSVRFALGGTLTIPSRDDQQIVEVVRLEMEPEFFYRAEPVLTPHVYRLANLTNSSDYVLLPGEASMYVGSDFVGRMDIASQIAAGEPFTVGFGTDPQLLIHRKLVEQDRGAQGGNQVLTYDYRIRAASYKSKPVKLQVWDRLPRPDGEKLAVSLVKADPPLSEEKQYLRLQRPENLLRWDVVVEPGQHGDDAQTITYEFKMEYARGLAIQGLSTGNESASAEAGVGMGGMGAGFRSVPESDR